MARRKKGFLKRRHTEERASALVMKLGKDVPAISNEYNAREIQYQGHRFIIQRAFKDRSITRTSQTSLQISHDGMMVYLRKGTQNELYVTGCWERELTRLYNKHFDDGDKFKADKGRTV